MAYTWKYLKWIIAIIFFFPIRLFIFDEGDIVDSLTPGTGRNIVETVIICTFRFKRLHCFRTSLIKLTLEPRSSDILPYLLRRAIVLKPEATKCVRILCSLFALSVKEGKRKGEGMRTPVWACTALELAVERKKMRDGEDEHGSLQSG
ncbi:hypothetical protein BT69DRAFT_104689 [Atractiella rhizophila]|nr:hypothetical protein BT69DRAFT_104689 [Atractiella rhizophila]